MPETTALVIDPREEKLPKWAREEFARLRRRTADAERDAETARLATDPADSDTLIEPYEPVPVGLGNGTPVRFLLGDDYVDVRVKRDSSGTYAEVMAGERVSVRPQSSNVVQLWPVPRFLR